VCDRLLFVYLCFCVFGWSCRCFLVVPKPNSNPTLLSAPIYVNIRYTRGKDELVHKQDVQIGRMPVMLKSSNCVLNGKSEEQLAQMNECPIDQGEVERVLY
jgi:hypothetical protein